MKCRERLGWSALLFAVLPAFGGETRHDHPIETDALREPRLETGGFCVIRGATIHSAVSEPFVGDVLVLGGDIAAVGEVAAPPGTVEIDGSGKHLAPGVVDCHSHMAIERGINEGTVSICAEVDIADVLNADDVTIYRALAGGVTTAHLLHGSANPIGGRNEVIKLRWHESADALRFEGAPQTLKLALGENPKHSNFGVRGARFPDSRLGVEAILHRAFSRAREYQRAWVDFEDAQARGEDALPPRRDIRLETLAGVLAGEIITHPHCYRADEILMVLACAERFGFTVGTLQHVLEGYKVAAEMAAHGAGGSTFGDWWAYKIEAYDAIPQNAALMDAAGVLTSVNSDSDEMVRRLYGEAAKSVRYGGLDRLRALRLVTLNPAQQLGIADRVGSIEPGKDADLVLLSGEPLSALSVVEWTMVDGELAFQRRDAFGLAGDPPAVAALTEPGRNPREDLYDPTGPEPIAITGATLHPITAADIENGTLVIQGDRIVRMGAGIPLPVGARVIDATGQHVWPGLVAVNTPLGLLEIDAVHGTEDISEVGGNQPDLRVAAAINAESAHIPVTRAEGVTRAQSAPQGGGPIMGQSALIRLRGDTWQELLVRDRDMLHLRFPVTENRAEDKEEENAAVEELQTLFEDAREYDRLVRASDEQGAPPPPFDRRLEALAPYAAGAKPVALHAQGAQTILFAIRFAQKQQLAATLFGLREGWKVAEAVAASGFPCVVGPVLALPLGEFDPYDAPYANAAVLSRAGVPVALMSADTQNPRNLAFHAAMACAFGLPREEALRAITFRAARVLGIEDEVGSLMPGKLADVIITEGDLLEITSPVEAVFIDGVQQSLETRQTRFHDRYRARLRRLTGR